MDPAILTMISRAKRRLWTVFLVRSLLKAVSLFAFLGMLFLVGTRLFYPMDVSGALYAALAGISVYMLVRMSTAPITNEKVALKLDVSYGLHERISSALSVHEYSAMGDALQKDAAFHLKGLRLDRVFPFEITRSFLYGLLLVSICLALYLYLPEKDFLGIARQKREREALIKQKREIAQKMMERVKVVQQKLEQEVQEYNFKQLVREIQELAQKMDKEPAREPREEIAKLSEIMQKLEKMQEKTLARMADLNPSMDQKASLEKLQETKNMAESLQKGDFQKAAQEMEKVREKLQQLLKKKQMKKKMSPQEQKSLEKLQQEMDHLQKMLQGNTPASEKLKETLRQLAEQLEKMNKLDQLSAQEEKQTQESLDKIKSAEEQLEELQKLLEQLKAMEKMYESLKTDRQEMAKCSGKKMSEMFGEKGKGDEKKTVHMPDMNDGKGKSCGNCQKSGCSICQGKGQASGQDGQGKGQGQGVGGKGEGQGQGGNPPESKEGKNGFKPLRLEGEKFEGKTIAEFKFEGEGPRGKDGARYREYAQKMANEATQGVSEEKIPQEYHEYIKKYFSTVTEEEK